MWQWPHRMLAHHTKKPMNARLVLCEMLLVWTRVCRLTQDVHQKAPNVPSRLIPPADRGEAIASFARLVERYLPGRELVVTVDEFVPERTTKQRNSLFGVAYRALMEQMGLRGKREQDDLHRDMCGEYFGWRELPSLCGARRQPVRTTTTDERGERDVLSVRQQMAFYAWLQKRAAEYEFDVPDPDPEYFRKAAREAEMDEMARRVAG